MKLFIMKYSITGCIATYNIVAENVNKAIEAGNKRCADSVGDSFKEKALEGEYLDNIDVNNVQVLELCQNQ